MRYLHTSCTKLLRTVLAQHWHRSGIEFGRSARMTKSYRPSEMSPQQLREWTSHRSVPQLLNDAIIWHQQWGREASLSATYLGASRTPAPMPSNCIRQVQVSGICRTMITYIGVWG